MSRIKEALAILTALGVPDAQQNERSALVLLALAGVGPRTSWSSAEASLLRTVDIMGFIATKHGKVYKPNSRETIRRQTLHQFEQARVVDRNPDDPQRPTNSGKNAYQLTPDALRVIRAYGCDDFNTVAYDFVARHDSLAERYKKRRDANTVPLTLPDGRTVALSPGPHNELQAAVVNQFGPRFAPGAQVLYLGDTAKKDVILAREQLAALNVPITEHDKLPDVILYDPEHNWLFLVEAVTSHGPVSPKRYTELEEMLGECTADRVYVTAFPSGAEFRKYATEVAWETEVWIADQPDHMIHFNGTKFLGPYER